jgi:hypothetical protein
LDTFRVFRLRGLSDCELRDMFHEKRVINQTTLRFLDDNDVDDVNMPSSPLVPIAMTKKLMA